MRDVDPVAEAPMDESEACYYASQSHWTDPGLYADLYPAELPVTQLADTVSSLVWHQGWFRRRGGKPADGSKDDIDQRLVREMIRRLLARDDRPLTDHRAGGACYVGTCRDTSTLACSILRHQDIPSRLRVGFASYFKPGFFSDHWVCEYWDGDTWRLLDAELDADTSAHYGIEFASWDVPRQLFLTAGEAWRAIRNGSASEGVFGVAGFGISGRWFVGASILRDLAALNKQELLPWDYWGLSRDFSPTRPPSSDESHALDAIASVIAPNPPDWPESLKVYETADAVQLTPTIISGQVEPIEISLAPFLATV
jgi:hypothetical protein